MTEMTQEELQKMMDDRIAAALAKADPKSGIDWAVTWSKVEKLVTPLLVALVGAGVLWVQSLAKDTKDQSVVNHEATQIVAKDVKAATALAKDNHTQIQRLAGNTVPAVVVPSEDK